MPAVDVDVDSLTRQGIYKRRPCRIQYNTRLKGRFPTASYSSDYRRFIFAFMIASTVIYDGSYSSMS